MRRRLRILSLLTLLALTLVSAMGGSPAYGAGKDSLSRINHIVVIYQPFSSHFRNRPFTIDDYIPPTATTCPPPGVFAPNGVPNGTGLPGGCTRDLVHRFYQEQYQLNDGRQNRYVTGSDAAGGAVRRLGGQHHPARLPTVRARDAGLAAAPAPDGPDHR